MINKEMKEHKSKTEENSSVPEKKPNEIGGYYFSSSVKIFDPNSNELILHTRGDD